MSKLPYRNVVRTREHALVALQPRIGHSIGFRAPIPSTNQPPDQRGHQAEHSKQRVRGGGGLAATCAIGQNGTKVMSESKVMSELPDYLPHRAVPGEEGPGVDAVLAVVVAVVDDVPGEA